MDHGAPLLCVADFERHAGSVLGKNAWDYYSSGANQQQTLKDNVDAFKSYRIRPRMLRDVSRLDTSLKILGEEIAFPICVAPTALQCMAHPDGEKATARACAKVKTCMTLSSWSTTSLEDVANSSGNGLRWFQLYIYRDKELTERLVARAQEAGYKAIVITVDTPILGRRLADTRNRFSIPPHMSLANFKQAEEAARLVTRKQESGLFQYTASLIDPSLTWESIKWVQALTSLPIVVKGILTAEDALEAIKCGVQGIIVSNHGARQLDGVPPSLYALPEVVAAVNGQAEVYLDGGIREGTDVLKALALGARMVLVGRPVLWGLAHNGKEGVEAVLGLLQEELRLAMMLSGCPKSSDITPNLVIHESHYSMVRANL